MTTTTHRAHPIAGIFPMMDDKRLERLADDIIVNGQTHPIVLFGDLIVDGRSRERACQMLGATPSYAEFTGTEEDILAYIVKQNLPLRDLRLEQRAMAAARLVNTGSSYFPATWKPDATSLTKFAVTAGAAAKLFGLHRSSVQKAKNIQQRATPEVVTAVDEGKMSLNMAYDTTVPADRRPVMRPAKKTAGERSEALRNKSNIYAHLRIALEELTSLPNPTDVAVIARALDRSDLTSRKLPLALKWLQEFAACLSSKN